MSPSVGSVRTARNIRRLDLPLASPPDRDLRLDFFRGLALLLIVMAHVPNNPWWLYMPQRFGFSDAASIFVFCSGVTSAIAFGATYARVGWTLGTLRILQRIWQVYWVHVATFIAIGAMMVWLSRMPWPDGDYVSRLNLWPFFNDTMANLLGFVTLTYVPNYFDILPMYIVLLAMVPVILALAAVHGGLVAAFVLVLYGAASFGYLQLPAEPWSERPWFFNPFAWQALFFIGFAMALGWLPVPAVTQGRMLAAALLVAALAPFAFDGGLHQMSPRFASIGDALSAFAGKTTHGPIRLAHFLALAYLAYGLCGDRGVRLTTGPEQWLGLVAAVSMIGRHSLAIFAFGLLFSQLLGVALDVLGRGFLATAIVNLASIGVLTAVALFLDRLKSAPWSRRPADPAAQGPAASEAPALAPQRAGSVRR